MPEPGAAAQAAADAQRQYWGRVLSATLRMARDLDIAEEATADAFVLALQTWPERGVPASVEAWLLTAARRRAIDRIRRLGRFRQRLAMIAATGDLTAGPADEAIDGPPVLDDELRLVVLCCHPALDIETQVALTMRLGCGVPTASIAAAFLVTEPTMAARLTRAKKRIAGSGYGHRAARRPGGRGAHAGGPPDDPPRLRHGPHRRIGPRAAQRRRHGTRPAPGPPAPRPASRRHRGRRPAGADPAHRGQGRHAPGRRRHAGAAGRRRSESLGRSPASRGPGAGGRPPSCPSGSARSGRSPRTQRRRAGPPGGHRRRARPRRDVRRHRLGGHRPAATTRC